MNCPNCGRTLLQRERLCPNCGYMARAETNEKPANCMTRWPALDTALGAITPVLLLVGANLFA